MNNTLKNTRDWIVQSSKSSFYDAMEEAKLTPRQRKILEMRFIGGLLNYQIAMEMNISVKTVEVELNSIYKAIFRILDRYKRL